MVDAVSAYDLCVETVRSESRSRYISLAYAPADVRSDLCALFAFEAEIRRIPLIVREPMAGEIRLQWWRDAIAKAESAVPLAAALNETIARHSLPLMAFDSLLDARVSDLYADPPSTTGDAEGHAG
ncbi:MAG: squalene/phytoene synthase family protein, partial [Pseudomonadota bacterium]